MLPAKTYRERLVRLLERGPKRPSDLPRRAKWRAFGRTLGELVDDHLTDRAAVLTYYGILAIFPGMLVLVAVVGLAGNQTAIEVVQDIKNLSFGPNADIIGQGVDDVMKKKQQAGIVAIVGLLVAFYSATGYVGAFIRAANAIYDVPEGRPVWKTLPLRILITIVTGLFLAISAITIAFTGRLAERMGVLLNIDPQRVKVFDIAKWPILMVAFALLMALLYWAAPNARQGGFAWITPGSLLATLVWIAVSGGFALYVARFNSYDRTYGALGGVIVFLVWMWLTNVAVLLGAEFDAELARERAIAAGLPAQAEPYLPLRDLPKDRVVEDPPDI